MAEEFISFVYDDNRFRQMAQAFTTLSSELPKYIQEVISRFAGTFRRNVYQAVSRNAGWASSYWQPLRGSYIRQKGTKRFWYKTGFLLRNMRPNAGALKLRNFSGSVWDVQVDLLEGLIKNVKYPALSQSSRGKTSKKQTRTVTTHDVFMYNEYGTKDIPARPVINPAFWRTMQMTNLADLLSQRVLNVLDRIPQIRD